MPNSKADAATPAPAAGTPGAGSEFRPCADDPASTDAPAPMNGITVTRWNFGVSLTLALGILGGSYMLLWDSTSRIETQVRGLSVDLHTEINGFRQEVRADLRDLRRELRGEIGALREDLRGEIGALREEIEELAVLIRTRDDATQ